MSSRKEEGGRLISQLLESLTTSVTFSFSKCSSIRLWLNHMVHGKFNSPYSFSQKAPTWDCQLFWMGGLKPPWDAPWEALRGKMVCLLFSTIPSAGFFYPAQKSILGLTTSHTETLSERQVSKIKNKCHVSVGLMWRRRRCTFLSSWFGSSSPELE